MGIHGVGKLYDNYYILKLAVRSKSLLYTYVCTYIEVEGVKNCYIHVLYTQKSAVATAIARKVGIPIRQLCRKSEPFRFVFV